jgi:hypothetical protein
MPSQLSFDEPPLYDAVVSTRSRLNFADIWVGYWSSFYQTLISYLSATGIFLPQLTQDEIDQLENLVNGQMIYNLTVDAPQFWQASSTSWRTFTFT